MTIRTKLKSLFASENITIKEVAEKLSSVKNKIITADSISQKLLRGTIKFQEVEEILDVLDYDIVFIKRD
ncbi:MAG: hypothetical protein BHW64_06105, partial [Candidatus Melainabacteria bacterium LEY3_CP_29_8]